MNQDVVNTAMELLVKIVRTGFAEFEIIELDNDEVDEDKTRFAIDTGWFKITEQEAWLLEELLGRHRKPPEPFVESRGG